MSIALEDSLEHLTTAQREAVEHAEGPLLILAGPGSGKTRVVTHRVAWLLHQGVGPDEILALTFTNKAAGEMQSRVRQLAPGADVWMGTFHRFCARLLRRYAGLVGLEPNYTIYDAADARGLVKRTMNEAGRDPSFAPPERIAAEISRAKSNLIPADEYRPQRPTELAPIVAEIYPQYQAALLAANAVDFDDLLAHVARLLRDNPELRRELDARYRYIMVDEYQDTNLAQYAIVRALSIDHPNLAVTGDPDQSIYSWRGANVSNILEFEKDYPDARVVRLEQNYRSTKQILSVADALIAHNTRRKHKALFTENESGQPVRMTVYGSETAEAEAIATRIIEAVRSGRRRWRDFVVFMRVNALSRPLEEAFNVHGVPFQIVRGQEYYQRKEIKDVVAYLQLINNPRDDVALERIINTPARGIGKKTVERLRAAALESGKCLLDAAREAGTIADLPKRAALAVARFVAMYDRLGEHAAKPVEELLGRVFDETKYRESLGDSEGDNDRLANLEEMLSSARQFDESFAGDAPLEGFLERASLVNETDTWDPLADRVTVMTLHAAKGLEFPVVFVVAVEEGILPHKRSRDTSAAAVEEERRLLFVGMTRAKQELYLSRASRRLYRGRQGPTIVSTFWREIPADEVDCENLVPDAPSVDESRQRARRGPSASLGRRQTGGPALKTAAELAGTKRAASEGGASPDRFVQDMLVKHPEYGLGKIVALSGEHANRRATVRFASEAGEKTFVLVHSKLEPAKGG